MNKDKKLVVKFKGVEKWGENSVDVLPLSEPLIDILKRNNIFTLDTLLKNLDFKSGKINGIGATKAKKIRIAFIEWYGSILSDDEQIEFLEDIIALNEGARA